MIADLPRARWLGLRLRYGTLILIFAYIRSSILNPYKTPVRVSDPAGPIQTNPHGSALAGVGNP